MGSSLVGNILKTRRKELDLPVKYVLEQLKNIGVNISDKTLYGWENGHRQPDADVFLMLCKIYEINSIAGLTKETSSENKLLSLSDENEKQLIELYREMNEEGKGKLLSYAIDLEDTGKYKKAGSFRMASTEV